MYLPLLNPESVQPEYQGGSEVFKEAVSATELAFHTKGVDLCLN